LIAFDPDSREVPKDLADHYRAVVLVDRAVTDRDDVDSVEFVLTRFPYCSSTLEPDLEALGNYSFRDHFVPESRESVQATSLNRVIDERGLTGIDWLKLDSQGTDLRIIRSLGPKALADLTAVEVEPGFINAYVGEDLFHDVHRDLTENGFWLCDLNCQAYPRVRPESVDELERLCRAWGVAGGVGALKASPTAAEARYLRELDPSMDARAITMLFVFATISGQVAFAFDVKKAYEIQCGADRVSTAMNATLRHELRRLGVEQPTISSDELRGLRARQSPLGSRLRQARRWARRVLG
jgi:hypothetical protein